MIGLDLSKTAEEQFSGWSWKGLVCALLAAFVLIAGADASLKETRRVQLAGVQKQYGAKPERVVLRWRDRVDPRGFTTPEETNIADDAFGLAWISGSSISVRADRPEFEFRGQKAYELTDVFAAQTRRINDRKFWIHEYLVQGVRTGDMRRAALHAANDPLVDAIVVSLNPVWLFNNWAIYTESNQRASIVAMKGAEPGDWVDAFRYARPSSIVGALLSGESKIVRWRYPLSRDLPSSKSLPFPLISTPDAQGVHYPRVPSFYAGQDFTAPKSMKRHEKYRATLLRQTLSRDSASARFFAREVRSLTRSGKPILLYVPPIPPGAKADPEVVAFMDEWSALAEEIVRDNGGPNVHLHTASWRKVAGKRVHKDIVHLHFGQGVVDEVTRLLRTELNLKIDKRKNVYLYGPEPTKDAGDEQE